MSSFRNSKPALGWLVLGRGGLWGSLGVRKNESTGDRGVHGEAYTLDTKGAPGGGISL